MKKLYVAVDVGNRIAKCPSLVYVRMAHVRNGDVPILHQSCYMVIVTTSVMVIPRAIWRTPPKIHGRNYPKHKKRRADGHL